MIRVAIAGAGGQIGYSLLPMIARGDLFGHSQRVVLQCLDLNLPEVQENLRGIAMELEDSNFPLLHSVVRCKDGTDAFKDADYALLLGAFPKGRGSDRDVMEKNVLIFRTMGAAIENHARKECKVIVVGSPANTNAFICAHYAPSRPKTNFFALSRLDHARALGQVAAKSSQETGQDVSVADVRNLVLWGNPAGTRVPDTDHCSVKGKTLGDPHSQATGSWLRQPLLDEIEGRNLAVTNAAIAGDRKPSAALSTACAIADHVRDLHLGRLSGELSSMGVWTTSSMYGLTADLVFSLPVHCQGRGRYRVEQGLSLSKWCKEKIKLAEAELLAERALAEELFAKHDFSRTLKR